MTAALAQTPLTQTPLAQSPAAQSPAARSPSAQSPPAWNHRAERGNALLSRVMIWLALHLGWGAGRLLLYPITAYFFLAAPAARRASARFLGRILGRPAGAARVFRHLHSFAAMLLDRAFFLAGRTGDFSLSVAGLEHLDAAIAQGRGVVLLGGHLGSFEALRAFGRTAPVPVRMLMYRANRGGFSQAMEKLDPTLADSVIEIGAPEAMLAVREAILRGEIVGILADRAPEPPVRPEGRGSDGGAFRRVRVPFLGAEADFPAGPFLLAAGLGAPVLLFFGLCTGPRRYELRFEPFAARLDLPRADRAAALRRAVLCYADRLAERARAYPFQWFNFHDLWGPTWEAPADARPSATAAAARPVRVAEAGPGD
ncbi:MAG TPA: acyltransferase [Acetobacteraceae bacterium]|nr:acyltransferase [Acetobacteraceae bacterium]